MQGARGIIVAQGEGDGVELLEGGPRGEVDGGLGERLELLIGRHDVGVAVALAAAALGVDGLGGEEAGPVDVEIGREDVLGEVVDALGVAAGDVAVAEVLRTTEPFLLSTRALSLVCRARDLVNSSMWRASSSAATVRLTYSEPLSE